jgi:hypothetical protein
MNTVVVVWSMGQTQTKTSDFRVRGMKNGEVWNLKVPREFEVSEAPVERWLCVSMQG